MANLSIHPAPGLGDLLPGFFAVPQNPIDVGLSGITYAPGIGDILPGAFAVPQNPIKDYTSGTVKLIGQQSGGAGQLNGQPTCGCGCGGHGGCGGGMGDISTDISTFTSQLTAGNFSGALSSPILGLPAYMYLLGIAGLLFFFGGSTGPSRATRARRAYKAYAS